MIELLAWKALEVIGGYGNFAHIPADAMSGAGSMVSHIQIHLGHIHAFDGGGIAD
jgi:hypothetical protein